MYEFNTEENLKLIADADKAMSEMSEGERLELESMAKQAASDAKKLIFLFNVAPTKPIGQEGKEQ